MSPTPGRLGERVQSSLDELVRSGTETGIQACVIAHGTVVVDAAAGYTDADRRTPVHSDTLFWAGSVAKGITASIVHVLVEEGALDYDLAVAHVWPEFAAHGKDRATVRDAVLHAAGVPGLPAHTTADDLCDWVRMCATIAASEPWWDPGSKMGYHAHTYGFLIGETVRRATGSTLSALLRELIATPIGMENELFFGVPDKNLAQVARQVRLAGDPIPATPMPGSPAARAMPIVPDPAYANRSAVLGADIPSQGVTSARAIAHMYSGLLCRGEMPALVPDRRRNDMAAVQFVGTDQVLGIETELGYGYSTQRPSVPSRSGSTFGMLGMNGCVGYADIDSGVAVAVMRNRFTADLTAATTVDRLVADASASPEPIPHSITDP